VVQDHGEELSGYDIYMAGPPPMIKAAREAFRERGVKDEQMHYDSFEYAAD
jgi:CDP-4-dehydro-6-deoxyglucose reductase